MSELHKHIAIPKDLEVGDRRSFESKLNEFTLAGARKMHVVFDFDRTLTVKRPGSLDEVTTWHILCQHLPEEGKKRYKLLFDKYRSLEIANIMTREDAIEWWSSILSLFVEYDINFTNVEKDFLYKATIRPGVEELFRFCSDNAIPTIILSAGISDVIEIWCKKYGISPSLIISTRLVLDENNICKGWEKETLVHALNKSEANHLELDSIRNKRPNAIVIGDSLSDAAMAIGDDNVIRVRVVDPRPDEIVDELERDKTFEVFDTIIRTGRLDPLMGIIKRVYYGTNNSIDV